MNETRAENGCADLLVFINFVVENVEMLAQNGERLFGAQVGGGFLQSGEQRIADLTAQTFKRDARSEREQGETNFLGVEIDMKIRALPAE